MNKAAPKSATYKYQTKPVIVITGPTATGKSALAIRLAQQFNGEIISADSMQLYAHLDVGTAKLRPEEMQGIPHHLLNILDLNENYSVANYLAKATAIIKDIYDRGKRPLICGGTGLYINALLDGLTFIDVPANQELRKKIEAKGDTIGFDNLWQQINLTDPDFAKKISPNDKKRIIRFFEIFEQTGLTQSQIKKKSHEKGPDFIFKTYVLDVPRDMLYERINQRCQDMFEQGILEEAKLFLQRDLSSLQHLNAAKAIGYQEALAVLTNKITKTEAVDLCAKATRHYAKRQLTWFRARNDVIWVPAADLDATYNLIIEDLK